MKRISCVLIACLAILLLNGCTDTAVPPEESSDGVRAYRSQPVLEGNIVHAATEPEFDVPDISGEELFQANVLSEFTTSYRKNSPNNKKNIARAASALNDVVVAPAETFSYNSTIGPTTKKNGFYKARIFVNGKDSQGYGGGVCQVSSTLYNAVLNAGLEVVERHPHSKAVTYVEKGKDAATSYGVIDFKFTNNKSYPIRLNTFLQNDQVTVSIIAEPANS